MKSTDRPADRRFDVLAIDLDGTLLDSAHQLPARNRAALHRAHAAGLRVALCTGRSYFETRPVMDAVGLDLDAVVTVFGAVVSEAATGRTLLRTPFAPDAAREATDWFMRRGYPVLWLTDRQEAGIDGYYFDGPRRHPGYERWMAESSGQMLRLSRPPADGPAPVRISIIDEPDALRDLSGSLSADLGGLLRHNVLRAPAYGITVIEAFDPRVNKWSAVQALCRRWGIDPRRTVALGDDVNDVDMIRGAGLGVAVANAAPEARAAAARVVASNDECGVADLIDELLEDG